jgi:hypothetical protein
MRRALLAGLMLLAVAGCKKEAPKAAADADSDAAPQIASLDDQDLPVDKSDQITAIDAATGDASGMPRDGGAVIVAPKPQARPTVQAPEETVNAAAPLVAPPPPPTPAPAPAPAATVTIPVGN